MMTIDEVSVMCGITPRAARKRAGIDEFFIGFQNTGNGRPVKLYRPEVLTLWNKAGAEIERFNRSKIRKERNDHGTPRRPEGWSKEARIELRDRVVARTLELWLSQAREDNVLTACVAACEEYGANQGDTGDFSNHIEMANYYYQKFIKRKDAHYVGAFHKDNWLLKHRTRFDVRGINDQMPKLRWDYIPLLTNYGLIGEGFGAGDLWVIDGSSLDVWVGGEKSRINYIQILCGVTRFPLLLRPLEDGESIAAVARIIAEAYLIYGVPRMGVVLDNGRAFSSATIEGLIKSLYSDAELSEFQTARWRRDIFEHERKAPLYYNIPNRPQFKFKAMEERSFREHTKFASQWNPLAYTGGNRTEGVSLDLSTTPTLPMKMAKPMAETWEQFQKWVYNHLIHSIEPAAFKSFRQLTGKLPRTIDAWQYYGGLQRGRSTYKAYPRENEPKIYYYLTPDTRELKHRVKVTDFGYLKVTHQNEMYNYHCPNLDPSYAGQGLQVCVVPRWDDPNEAYLYLEHNPKRFDERTPEDGSVHYIGTGVNHWIRGQADIPKIQSRKTNQKIQQQWLQDNAADTAIEPLHIEDRGTPLPEVQREQINTGAADILNTSKLQPAAASDDYDYSQDEYVQLFTL